jgi:short-subunit dehydrogenase
MNMLLTALLAVSGGSAEAGPFLDKVAIVTGSSSGIGRELAREAHRRGMKVALVDVRPEGSRELARGLAKEPGRETMVIVADLAKPEDRARVFKEARERFGRIDALFNNAGYGYMASIEEFDLAAAKRQFDVNYWAYVDLANRAYGEMKGRKAGWVINVASLMGMIDGFERTAMYSASKHALVGWGRTVAPEFKRAGIEFKVVCPTGVKTKFLDNLQGRGAKSVRERVGDARDDFDDPAAIAREVFDALGSEKLFLFPGSAPDVMPEGLAAFFE